MDTKRAMRVETGQDWLTVPVHGAYNFTQLNAFIPTIGDAAKAAQARAVLIDFTQVSGSLEFSDRFELAVTLADQEIGVPIAVVATEALVDPRRFGELVARNRGVDLRVFTQVVDAHGWLHDCFK